MIMQETSEHQALVLTVFLTWDTWSPLICWMDIVSEKHENAGGFDVILVMVGEAW